MDRGGPLDRLGLKDALSEFGIAAGSDRTFRYAVKAVGIQPVEATSKQGRSHLYDPISAWTLFCVHRARQGALSGLSDELDTYRELAHRAWELPNASAIPGFVADKEYAAQLLLIFSPDYGVPPRELIGLLRQRPQLLEYCRHGRDYLYDAMDSYKHAYAAWLLSEPLIREFWSDPHSDQGLRRRFAELWVEHFGGRFRHAELGRQIESGDVQDPNEL